MRLTGIKPGDLIEVDDGMPFIARVIDRPAKQRVRCQPLTYRAHPRDVRARDVTAHYRKAKA